MSLSLTNGLNKKKKPKLLLEKISTQQIILVASFPDQSRLRKSVNSAGKGAAKLILSLVCG